MAPPGSETAALLDLVARQTTPLTLAHEQTLPVLPVLEGLLPGGALRRGSTVEIHGIGATSLALALAAKPSAAGSWTALVGVPSIGLMAAGEAGLSLNRLFVVRPPTPGSWSGVVASLVGSVDVIVVAGGRRAGNGDLRRLTARLRERGSVLIRVGDTPWISGSSKATSGNGADVRMRIVSSKWEGLGDGHGVLRRRCVEVRADGRGASARPRSAQLFLPGSNGAPEPVELASVAQLRVS